MMRGCRAHDMSQIFSIRRDARYVAIASASKPHGAYARRAVRGSRKFPRQPAASAEPRLQSGNSHVDRCAQCLNRPPHFASARSMARYRPSAESDRRSLPSLIRRHKYGLDQSLQIALAEFLGDELPYSAADCDVVIPVPLHSRQLWWRGFNQAALLAMTISHHLEVPIELDGADAFANDHPANQSGSRCATPQRPTRLRRRTARPHQRTPRVVGRRRHDDRRHRRRMRAGADSLGRGARRCTNAGASAVTSAGSHQMERDASRQVRRRRRAVRRRDAAAAAARRARPRCCRGSRSQLDTRLRAPACASSRRIFPKSDAESCRGRARRSITDMAGAGRLR